MAPALLLCIYYFSLLWNVKSSLYVCQQENNDHFHFIYPKDALILETVPTS